MVVVVVDTAGRGIVVVCSVVLVRVVTGDGPPQPASIAVPAISAMPNARPKRDVLMFIV